MNTGVAAKVAVMGSGAYLIHTWLQPGVLGVRITRNRLNGFQKIAPILATWLKPDVNKKSKYS